LMFVNVHEALGSAADGLAFKASDAAYRRRAI
jgi:hypothetical protein